MRGRTHISQLNKRQKDILFYISLVILSLLIFMVPGERGYVLFDDSPSYMNFYVNMEGVMPGYPLFLHGNKLLFGEERYLYAVVVEQTLIATLCVIIFVAMVRNKFRLRYWESYICYALTLLPFTTNMPGSMTTHEIVTEGIAYALFYLFAVALLQTIWSKSWRWLGALCAMTLVLALIRSQLQILFGVCGVVCIYIAVLKPGRSERRKKKWMFRLLLGLVCCVMIGMAGVGLVMKVNAAFRDIKIRVRSEEEMNVQQAKNTTMPETEEAQKQNNASRSVRATSQYVTLIFSRGMYEAEYDDYLLFEDEQVRELYLFLYQRIDKKQQHYVYAQPGLWMWRDIVNGIGSIAEHSNRWQNRFYNENYPELVSDSSYASVRDANQIKIGLTLIKEHFGRFLYHTLIMLPQAFICTVFFQIERIYLLCHLATLFIYLTAAALMIWAYKDRKVETAYGEFMCAILGTNLVLILVISLVFFGQQRYLVYNFGIFYVSYFLLFIQLLRLYGKQITDLFHKDRYSSGRAER